MTRQPTGLFGRLYSRRIARQLGSCGRNVQIEFPATVKNPGSISLGEQVVIRSNAWLNCEHGDQATLVVGDRSYIGRFAHINAALSVIIEPDVLIADRVHISDYQHAIDDVSLPVIAQGLTTPQPVRIASGSWIGVGAVIMPGLTIGQGAVVGANAVVTRDVAAFDIVAGVPAVTIGSRCG